MLPSLTARLSPLSTIPYGMRDVGKVSGMNYCCLELLCRSPDGVKLAISCKVAGDLIAVIIGFLYKYTKHMVSLF